MNNHVLPGHMIMAPKSCSILVKVVGSNNWTKWHGTAIVVCTDSERLGFSVEGQRSIMVLDKNRLLNMWVHDVDYIERYGGELLSPCELP